MENKVLLLIALVAALICMPVLSAQPLAANLRGPYCGAAIMYRSLKCPKSAVWVQGSTHGYVPPMPQKIVW